MLAVQIRHPFTVRALAVSLCFLLLGCGDSAIDDYEPVSIPLPDVAALAQLSTGEILAADRLTGTIYRFALIDPDPVVVGRVSVSTDGQRGLLGLAVDANDRVYAAWTQLDNRLVVGEVLTSTSQLELDEVSETRPVWNGFESSTGANGGHLEFLPAGTSSEARLVIGVGTLRRSAFIDDPEAVNGKMLAIDLSLGADQRPEILSSGWKNPFAFTVNQAGELWVADNEPEDGSSERIGRGDLPDAPRLDLAEQLAPSALVELGPDRLGVCSFITGELRTIALQSDRLGSSEPGAVLLNRCRTAALVIDENWILTSDLDSLELQRLPGD